MCVVQGTIAAQLMASASALLAYHQQTHIAATPVPVDAASTCTLPPISPTTQSSGGSGPSQYEPDYEQQQYHQQHGNGRQQHGRHGNGQAAGSSNSYAYPGVSTQGLEGIGYGDQAAVIDAETQQQNTYLDEISKGLDQLKFGAQVGWLASGDETNHASVLLRQLCAQCVVSSMACASTETESVSLLPPP